MALSICNVHTQYTIYNMHDTKRIFCDIIQIFDSEWKPVYCKLMICEYEFVNSTQLNSEIIFG